MEAIRPMKTYEFSIIASGLNPEADDFESRFYDAGCDDATVSFQRGHIILDFAREAIGMEDAIGSAVSAVETAGATVDRVEPDPLVTLSEIAARAGVTRAAITQYAKGQRASGFPPPTAKVTSGNPLWRWSSVARWLCRRGNLSEAAAAEAEAIDRANERLAARRGGRAA
jgi:hypothetical protein